MRKRKEKVQEVYLKERKGEKLIREMIDKVQKFQNIGIDRRRRERIIENFREIEEPLHEILNEP